MEDSTDKSKQLKRVDHLSDETKKLIFASIQEVIDRHVGRGGLVQEQMTDASQPAGAREDRQHVSPSQTLAPKGRVMRKQLATKSKAAPPKQVSNKRKGGTCTADPPAKRVTRSSSAQQRRSPRVVDDVGEQESNDGDVREPRAHARGANIRCIPLSVVQTIQMLSGPQREKIERLGWKDLLKIQIDGIESRELLTWLMDRIDPDSMSIPVGRGKRLFMQPHDLHLAIGMPFGGTDLKVYDKSTEEAELNRMRVLLDVPERVEVKRLQDEIRKGRVDELSLRCFFMILSARLLFCRPKFHVGNEDICFSLDPESLGSKDICIAAWKQLQNGVRDWQSSTAMYPSLTGCSIFLLIFFLDHLNHPISCENPFLFPRSAFYTKEKIQTIAKDAKRIDQDGDVSFLGLEIKHRSSTIYGMVPIDSDEEDVGRAHDDGVSTFHLPRLGEVLASKLRNLEGHFRLEVEHELGLFDRADLLKKDFFSFSFLMLRKES